MEQTDLMIGDLVFYKKYNKAIKVEEILIFYDEEYHMCINREWTNQEGVSAIKLEAIEPIPLTPQILEKNGWKKHATYGLMEDDVKEDIYMLYEHEFEIVFINQEPVSIRRCIQSDDDGYDKLLINYQDTGMYVHVLQHALRLFGLNKLADNFKIE